MCVLGDGMWGKEAGGPPGRGRVAKEAANVDREKLVFAETPQNAGAPSFGDRAEAPTPAPGWV